MRPRRWSALLLILGIVLASTMVASAATPVLRLLAKFGTSGAGMLEFNSPRFVAVLPDSTLAVSDFQNDRVMLVKNAAYVGDIGGTGTGPGQFLGPSGVAADSQGNLYVAETANHRISRFDSNGSFVVTWGFGVQDGSNHFQSCSVGCQAGIPGAGVGQLNGPRGIRVDAADNIYVADTNNDRVNVYVHVGSILGSFGATGTGNGQFDSPNDIAIDSAGNRYVVDRGNHRVQRFDSSNAYVSQFGAFGSGKGELNDPAGIAIDSRGIVSVAEAANHRVSRFEASGLFESMFGFGVVSPGGGFEVCLSSTASCRAGESGAGDRQFSNPNGLIADALDNVVIVDTTNDRVQVLGAAFLVLDGYGGVHAAGSSGPVDTSAPYFGFDIAKDLLPGKDKGFLVLDGYGGLHAGGGGPMPAPPFPLYRYPSRYYVDFEHDPASPTGLYVLDWPGMVHASGGAPVISPASPYFGCACARDIEMVSGGYLVLDEFGGIWAGGGATPPSPGLPYYWPQDYFVAIEAAAVGVYALDKYGGMYAVGGAAILTPVTPYFGFDIARDFELSPTETGYYVLDGFGGVHQGGDAPPIIPGTPYFGFDIARDLEIG